MQRTKATTETGDQEIVSVCTKLSVKFIFFPCRQIFLQERTALNHTFCLACSRAVELSQRISLLMHRDGDVD